MAHEQTHLVFYKGFGGISSCSCGLYHINLPGVSLHLNEKGFDHLVQMILQAKESQDLQQLKESAPKKSHLLLVKN